MIKRLKNMKTLHDTGKLNFLRKHVNICNYTIIQSILGLELLVKLSLKNRSIQIWSCSKCGLPMEKIQVAQSMRSIGGLNIRKMSTNIYFDFPYSKTLF